MRQLSFTFNHTSPIQRHTWIDLNPHSYLLTFWAWSNIVAFREMSWSSSTLVIHYARSSIKSIKSGSLEALHPPEKEKKKRLKQVSLQSYSKKKGGQRGRMEKPKSNTTKDIHPAHTHAHDQVLKMTWSLNVGVYRQAYSGIPLAVGL
jgi:hypothetical protein